MGSDLVGPGTGWQLTNDDWFGLRELIWNGHEALNRTHTEAADLFERLIDDEYTEVWVVHDPEGYVIGFVALHLGTKTSDRHTASLRIHVTDEFQGKGYGSRLIRVALKWADENGITRVAATPYSNGTAKLGFFGRHGFEPEGIARKAVKVGDRLVDIFLLARVT